MQDLIEMNVTHPDTGGLFSDLLAEYGSKLVLMPDKPEETIETNVRALWQRSAGIEVSGEKAMEMALPELSAEQIKHLREFLEQRLLGIPLAHLTGRQSFLGLEFICSKDALIPRKETEILARVAIDLLRQEVISSNPAPRVLDLCCGSGNVAIAIAAQVPSSSVVGTDLSPEAVALANQNAAQLSCSERVKFFSGDLFAPFESADYLGSFDLLTCNPPYISTGKLASMPVESIGYEPKLAFDGGPLGAGVLWRLLDQAPRFIKPGGWLAFEAGLAQGPGMLRRLSKLAQYTNVRGVSDQAGNPRTIVGQTTGQQASRPGPSREPAGPQNPRP